MASTIEEKRKALLEKRKQLYEQTKTNKDIGSIISGSGVTVPVLFLKSSEVGSGGKKSRSTMLTFRFFGSFKDVSIPEENGKKLSNETLEINVLQRIEPGNVNKKPVYKSVSTMKVNIGDEIQASMFNKIPKRKNGAPLEFGDFAYISGLMPIYNEERDRVFWNCAAVHHSPELGDYLTILRDVEKIPFDKIRIEKIVLPEPMPPEDDRKNWSEDLWENFRYLKSNFFIPVWESSKDDDKKMRGTVFDQPIYQDSENTWSYESSNNETQQKVRVLIPVTKWDYEKEGGFSEMVLLQIWIQDHAVRDFGITNPENWKYLAKYHVPFIKYAVRCFISHKSTVQDKINSPANDTSYGYTLNLVATNVFVDMTSYIRESGLPVTYDFVKKTLGEMLDSPYAEKNPLAKITGNRVVNLNEYHGSLTTFRDGGYSFYVLVNMRTTNARIKKIINDEWGGGEEAAKRCSAELEGEGEVLNLPDPLVINFFAVKNDPPSTSSNKRDLSPPPDQNGGGGGDNDDGDDSDLDSVASSTTSSPSSSRPKSKKRATTRKKKAGK